MTSNKPQITLLANVLLIAAFAIFIAFFCLVAVGASQRSPIVSDVTELLILGSGVVLFVPAVLLKEYLASSTAHDE